MRKALCLLGALGALFAADGVAAQSLTFQPQRIVMDARVGSSSLQISNTGKEVGSYRVELVDMIYQDDGKVVPAAKTPPGYPSAKELIRFSPSQIRLEPGESQTVRILVTPAAASIEGEYRVHALLKQLPNVANIKEPARKSNTVTGTIGIEQSVAIPVIVRRGNTSATGSIVSMRVVDGKPGQIDMSLGRNGNRSLYTIIRLKNKAGAVVEEIKGVAVPVPNKTRRFFFPLSEKVSPAQLRGGGYTIEMIDHDNQQVVLDAKPVR